MKIGIYNRWLPTLGGGERYSLSIAAHLAKDNAVTVLSHEAIDPALIRDRLALDVSRVHFQVIPHASNHDLAAQTASYDFFVNASNWDFFPSQARCSALVVYFPYCPGNRILAYLRYGVGKVLCSPFASPLRKQVLEPRIPGLNARLENLIDPNFLRSVATYSRIWAISKFSQQWVQRCWQVDSQLLFPPVDVDQFQPLSKEPKILHVGRFFAGNHNKKHLTLVDAFRQMVDAGLSGWELHLAGSINQGAEHAAYLQSVRAAIGNYPITLHENASFAQLQRLYGVASIYWHASGYGEDEQHAPHKSEHFGITTVEAMAAGCVPVVIGKGGQPELIETGVNGFLWYTLPELIEQTQRVIAAPMLRERLAQAAVHNSRRFDSPHFTARLDELIQSPMAAVHKLG